MLLNLVLAVDSHSGWGYSSRGLLISWILARCIVFLLVCGEVLHACSFLCWCFRAPGQELGRDQEMEEELTSAANSDPMAAYDVDVTEEGQAIHEYMFLLNDSHA